MATIAEVSCRSVRQPRARGRFPGSRGRLVQEMREAVRFPRANTWGGWGRLRSSAAAGCRSCRLAIHRGEGLLGVPERFRAAGRKIPAPGRKSMRLRTLSGPSSWNSILSLWLEALARAWASAASEKSRIVTCQPLSANQMAWRPTPPAMSRAVPACGKSGSMNSLAASTRNGSGSSEP